MREIAGDGYKTTRAGVAGSLVRIWGSVSGLAIYRKAWIMRFIYTAVTVGCLLIQTCSGAV